MKLNVLSPAAQLEACRDVVRTRAAVAARGLRRAERARRARAARAAVAFVVERNQGIVALIARRHARRCRTLDLEDLMQHGNLGLLRALDLYDPDRGTRFVTYAAHWIASFIGRAVAEEDSSVRVPVWVSEEKKKIDREARRFEARTGRTAGGEAIARELGIGRRRVDVLGVNTAAALSLDDPLGHDGDATFLDVLAGADELPDDAAERREREAWAAGLLSVLKPRELAVVVPKFWGGKTLAAIGAEDLGRPVSRERARQLELAALDRMRRRVGREGVEHAAE